MIDNQRLKRGRSRDLAQGRDRRIPHLGLFVFSGLDQGRDGRLRLQPTQGFRGLLPGQIVGFFRSQHADQRRDRVLAKLQKSIRADGRQCRHHLPQGADVPLQILRPLLLNLQPAPVPQTRDDDQ